uniref:Large ribosomal subunit protein uL13m n=1 Tax=Phallusia mammillata TaxID=59560 RepID=A0A6F9DKI1_9ASCI|nr:39S ribosomal protein L13, mitochondrial-like [Phallusia mammillata]
MSFGRANQQWATFSRVWHILNADRQPAGGIGVLVSRYVQGLHKPIYHPTSDVGDHVVVVNAKKIAYSGNKWEEKVFTAHTGRRKGRVRMQAFKVHELDPTWIIRRNIYRQIPNNLLRRTLFQRVHVFEDENVPAEIIENVTNVLIGPRPVPKAITDYTEEEKDSFPKLFLRDKYFLKS